MDFFASGYLRRSAPVVSVYAADVLPESRSMGSRTQTLQLDWEQAWFEHSPDADLWGDDELLASSRYYSEAPEWLPDYAL